MVVIYLVSILLLFFAFILIKKTDKVVDIVSFVGITIVSILCYNALICYILTFISVKINLLNLSIINFILASGIFFIIAKVRKIQQYKFDKMNLICVLIILVSTLAVSYLEFGFPFSIKYESGDASVHYLTSAMFAEQDTLLNISQDEIYGSFQGRKIGSYVNSGIIMKCFSGNLNEIEYYNIFISFGIFILFMTGSIMYSALEKFTKGRYSKSLALIVSFIFIMGYPLNSLLFGFEYLSLGILLLCTIIHMIYYFEKEELKCIYYIIIFMLLNFGVFCSYYMFVPFTYSALWIYFCIYSYKKDKKIICKKNITLLSLTLLVPFFLGYIYHLAPGIYNIFNIDAWEALQSSLDFSANILNNSFGTYGYIYVNYYSNMIILLPLTIYYVIQKNKQKNLSSFDIILLISIIIFIEILFIGLGLEKVSDYFLMKNYYALWIVLIYMNFKGLMQIFEKNKIRACLILGLYLLLIVINLIFLGVPLNKIKTSKKETNLTEIFGVNKTMLFDRKSDYTTKELDILKYAKANLDFENNEIEILGEVEQVFWGYSLLRYVNYDYNTNKYDIPLDGQNKLNMKCVETIENIGKIDYIIYFTKTEYYQRLNPILFENGEIIYENEAGGIVKYDKNY